MSPVKIHRVVGGVSPALEAPPPLRVAIADDHPAYRDRLGIFLRDSGLDVVGEASNGRAAVELSESADPDVILMDLRMPLLSGFGAIRQLNEVVPHCRVLAISAAASEAEIADAILLGANGHIPKDRPLMELIWALKAIAAGRPLVPAGTAQVLMRRIDGDGGPERSLAGAQLSRRDLDLLARLAWSHSIGQIADSLESSIEEVGDEIELMLMKLRVERRAREMVP